MTCGKKELFELRKRLLNNGYTPLPNRDKACYLEGWPKVHPDEETLKRWGRMRAAQATGIRVENGLCVVDLDIDHAIIEDVAEAMLDVLPENIAVERLERTGKGHKLAWYCRTNDLFARLHTRRWVAEGDTEDDATHSVEIFGGGSPRQFGSFGPHTIDEDGNTVVAYKWVDESPEDVALQELDVVTKDQCFAMLDAAEAVLKRYGFTPVARTKRGEGTSGKVYDLTEDMVFDMADGQSVGLGTLTEMVQAGYTGRCSASWLEGATAKNTSRCLVTKSGGGHVAIWESSEGTTHMPASLKPTDFQEQVDRVAEKLRQKQDARRSRLNENDDHISGAGKLLLSHAYQANSNRPVVPLWPTQDDPAISLTNFRVLNAPYCGVEIGPRGGEKRINPVDVWLSNPNRVHVSGTQMRPDRERPTFNERGATWVNSYSPPDPGSADGGNANIGIKFMEQLVPNPIERDWFCKALAYKWRNPHIPGPGIIMVARDFGTGRGTFVRLLKLMYGSRYVAETSFKHFTGQTYQSQYTDWAENALYTVVNESSAAGEQGTYRTKHDVYEHLKEVVDPAPTERLFIKKGEQAVRGYAFATSIILTNNPDAIPLPDDDRRFAVLSGGSKRSPEYWQELNLWLGRQANIAAFIHWLEEMPLEGYDPFEVPLWTAAKSRMAAANKSELDEIIETVLKQIDGYFVIEQVLQRITEIRFREKLDLPDRWHSLTKIIINKFYVRVQYPESMRNLETQIAGKTYRTIFFKGDEEPSFSTQRIRSEILKNGIIFSNEENTRTNVLSIKRGCENDAKGKNEN